MDDLGVPLFQETPMWRYPKSSIFIGFSRTNIHFFGVNQNSDSQETTAFNKKGGLGKESCGAPTTPNFGTPDMFGWALNRVQL